MRPGLYAILDLDVLAGRDVASFAERVLAAGALAAVQLRAKSAGAREALAVARALAPLCARAGVPFYVNDRPDLALLAGATGVHVGGDDLPVADVRRFAPALGIRPLDAQAPTSSTRASRPGPTTWPSGRCSRRRPSATRRR